MHVPSGVILILNNFCSGVRDKGGATLYLLQPHLSIFANTDFAERECPVRNDAIGNQSAILLSSVRNFILKTSQGMRSLWGRSSCGANRAHIKKAYNKRENTNNQQKNGHTSRSAALQNEDVVQVHKRASRRPPSTLA